MSCRNIEHSGGVTTSHLAGHLVPGLGLVALEVSEVARVDPVILDIVRSHTIVSQCHPHRLSVLRGDHSLCVGPQDRTESLRDLTVEHQFVRVRPR